MATPTLLQGLMNPQVVDAGGAMGQGLQNVQRIQQIGEAPMRNKLLGLQTQQAEQSLAANEQDMQIQAQKAEAQSLMSGINAAERFIEAGDIEGLNTYLTGRESEISARGGDPRHTVGFKQQIMQGPAEGESEQDYLKRLKSELQQDKENLYESGLVERSDEELEILKETRKDLEGRFGKFDEGLGGLELNYKKISNLSDAISNNNRMAVAQGIIAMVKLGEPNSAVLESEMRAALNQQDPLAATIGILKEAGLQGLLENENIDKVMAKIDPLSPANVNADELLGVANTVADASLSSLEGQYSQLKDMGSDLTSRGKKRLFSKEREGRVSSLRKDLESWKKNNVPPEGYVKQTNSKGEVRWRSPDGANFWTPSNG